MIRYFLKRPIAILMCCAALVCIGLYMTGKVPVSLLPDADVPMIVVRVTYPNTAAAVLDKNVMAPIRENLGSLNRLKNMESRTANHTGLLYLTFAHGTRMDLTYIEVNEKLDHLAATFPRDMERPVVMRINTSDIPIVCLQVIPKEEKNYLQISMFCEKILKKKLEQVPGVSLVDINGSQREMITVAPDDQALKALNMDRAVIVQAIAQASRYLGGLNISEGQYRYFVKLGNKLTRPEDIAQLPITTKDGAIIPLSRLASVKMESEQPTGYHMLNGKKGIVMTIQEQPDSRMNELMPLIRQEITQFSKDYPEIDFQVTQDQTFLLDAGISNLYQDLIYGGILTILLLFMFMGNLASPILMSISIPLSLIITFIFFYIFNISFNIISLSGLALGVGMLIDNSIVVIDNITRRRREGLDATESSVQGVNEVVAPVISQVLTTVAVYVPLVLLGGIAGALVYDQSIALTISLGVSLLIAFILSPVLYKLLLKKSPTNQKEDTYFYRQVSAGYHKMIHHILQHKSLYFIITLLIMPLGWWFAAHIPVSHLPVIEKKEGMLKINWNAPLDANENLRRVQDLLSQLQANCKVTEAEVGIRQFLLQQDNGTIETATVYYMCNTEEKKQQVDKAAAQWMKRQYPEAILQIADAPNAFTQLFVNNSPWFEARFKPAGRSNISTAYAGLDQLLKELPADQYHTGYGMIREPNITVMLDYEKMALYQVNKPAIEQALQQMFGTFNITSLNEFGDVHDVRFKANAVETPDKLNSTVKNASGIDYPLSQFVQMVHQDQQKFITADRTGEYRAVYFDKQQVSSVPALQNKIVDLSKANGLSVDFSGSYFESRSQLKTMQLIFFIVLLLLYILLVIQYEHLLLPLIVMLTIPLGITGSMFLLWITGGTLDVMAAVGFVVILGLIVDDPILKIEVLIRLEKKYSQQGLYEDKALLEKMIHEAGEICLKPLLMVSLTTSMAMVPVLLVSGIGNDLQKPMAIVIIGGLTIGTFFTTWFIPLAYWYLILLLKKPSFTRSYVLPAVIPEK